MPAPILSPDEERLALGETQQQPEDTSWYRGYVPGSGDYDEFMSERDPVYNEERKQRVADQGFDRYLARQPASDGNFDAFLAQHQPAPGDDMSDDELRRLLGGHPDVMGAARMPSPQQPPPQDRWYAAYAETMRQMGVPEEYWRRRQDAAPMSPYQQPTPRGGVETW